MVLWWRKSLFVVFAESALYEGILWGALCAASAIGLACVWLLRHKRYRRRDREFYFAVSGLILGLLWAIVSVVIPNYVYITYRYDAEGVAVRIRQDMARIGTALEIYLEEHRVYPPADIVQETSFHHSNGTVTSGYLPSVLSTPVAYLRFLPADPFSHTFGSKRRPYRYATDGKVHWALASVGPGGAPDSNLREYLLPDKANCNPELFFSHLGSGSAVEYDPSNGVTSTGDIIILGP
jgi:hypothetical protein